jgi:hypothetical protein
MITDNLGFDPYSLAGQLAWENSPSLQTGDLTKYDYYQLMFNPQPTGAYEWNSGGSTNDQTPFQITKEVYSPDVTDVTPVPEVKAVDYSDFASLFQTSAGGALSSGGLWSDIEAAAQKLGLESTAMAGPGGGGAAGLAELIFPGLMQSVGPAPKASLITGSCPPGRRRRTVKARVILGRDICARKPRMNVLNPKALARSVRRLAGFQTFATRTEKVIQHSFRKAGVHPVRRIGGRCGTCRKSKCSCG